MVTIPQAEQQTVNYGLNSPTYSVQPRSNRLGNVYAGFDKALGTLTKTAGDAMDILRAENDKTAIMEMENSYKRATSAMYAEFENKARGKNAPDYVESVLRPKLKEIENAFFSNDEKVKKQYHIDYLDAVPERLRQEFLNRTNPINTSYISRGFNFAGQEVSKARNIAYTNLQNQNVNEIANSDNIATAQASIDSLVNSNFNNIGVYDPDAAMVITKEKLDQGFSTYLLNQIISNPEMAANQFKSTSKNYTLNGTKMALSEFLNDDSKAKFISKLKPALEKKYVDTLAQELLANPNYDINNILENDFEKLANGIYIPTETEEARKRISDKAKQQAISLRNQRLDIVRECEDNSFSIAFNNMPKNPNTTEAFNILNNVDLKQYDKNQVQSIYGYMDLTGEVLHQIDDENETKNEMLDKIQSINSKLKTPQGMYFKNDFDSNKFRRNLMENRDKAKEYIKFVEQKKLNGQNFLANMDKYYTNKKFNIQTVINTPEFQDLDGESKYEVLQKSKQIIDFNSKVRPLLEAQKIDIDREIEDAQNEVLGNKQLGKFARAEVSAEVYKILMDDQTKLSDNTTPENMKTYINGVIVNAKQNSLNAFNKETIDKLEEVYDKAWTMVSKKKAATYDEALQKLILDEGVFWQYVPFVTTYSLDNTKNNRYYRALLSRDFTTAARIIEEK